MIFDHFAIGAVRTMVLLTRQGLFRDRLNCPCDGEQAPAKQNVHSGWQK